MMQLTAADCFNPHQVVVSNTPRLQHLPSVMHCWHSHNYGELELLICLHFPMAATGINKEGVSL